MKNFRHLFLFILLCYCPVLLLSQDKQVENKDSSAKLAKLIERKGLSLELDSLENKKFEEFKKSNPML